MVTFWFLLWLTMFGIRQMMRREPSAVRTLGEGVWLLRYGRAFRIIAALLAVAIVASWGLSAARLTTYSPFTVVFWTLQVVFLPLAAYLLLEGFGRRVVVDRDGIAASYGRSFQRYLAWADVRSVRYRPLLETLVFTNGAGRSIRVSLSMHGADDLAANLPELVAAPAWVPVFGRLLRIWRSRGVIRPLPGIWYELPESVRKLPEAERGERVQLDGDFCVLDGERYFVRGALKLPVTDYPHPLLLSVWGQLRPEHFWHYYENFREPNFSNTIGPCMGRLATAIGAFDPPTTALKLDAVFNRDGERPTFHLAPVEHPLVNAEHDGITLQRALTVYEQVW